VCCIVAVAALIGPRVAIVLWWLFDPARWALAFGGAWIVPVLGFFFLPWTTLVIAFLAPFGGIAGLGLLWVLLAVIVDLGAYGGGYRSRSAFGT
jgi:Na+/melibiose symporter-like transporter